jgi:hypothetical protein
VGPSQSWGLNDRAAEKGQLIGFVFIILSVALLAGWEGTVYFIAGNIIAPSLM